MEPRSRWSTAQDSNPELRTEAISQGQDVLLWRHINALWSHRPSLGDVVFQQLLAPLSGMSAASASQQACLVLQPVVTEHRHALCPVTCS